MRIGYLGLGAMGGALSTHLAKAFKLTVYDRNPAAIADLVSHGAVAAASPVDLARKSDVILLCLPRTSDVEEAIFSIGGLAEGLTSGKMVIDQTSGVPGLTNTIAARLAEKGVDMLDAPVSGGIPAAKAGSVTIIASGSGNAWRTAEPVLKVMTPKVFRCSDRVGDGQALKLVNNAIGAGYRMATLELVALGRKAGLSLQGLVARLNTGPGANFTSRNMLVGLVEGRSTTNFALLLMIKDLNEALSLGLAYQAQMPMTAAARGLMQTGLNLLGTDARLDDVISLTEKLSGVALSDLGKPDSGVVGKRETSLMADIENAAILCNCLAVFECVAMGAKFGLSMAEMARILNVGSAWCAVSELVLPALSAGKMPETGLSLADAQASMARLCQLAGTISVPLFLPNAVLGCLQALQSQHGAKTDIGMLGASFGLPQRMQID